ncbi:MAG: hypothetical protein IH897_13415, partial [Planctomycetes bacterium]|nr:hypothetical protein [Planctomycetota bacterium]
MDVELRRDLKTLATFVLVYCHHKHHDAMKTPVRLKTHDLEKIAGRPIRICDECNDEHPIGDSEDYTEAAELEGCECPCGSNLFEITIGVSLYEGSEDVR